MKRTEEEIIKKAQYDAFTEEIKASVSGKELPKKSSILTFTPIVPDGILRSNTRLRYSTDLPDETKYRIILPKKHYVTELILKYHHETEGHEMGLNYTLNHLREKYIVVHGREIGKKLIKKCSECRRRFRGKPATQQMAALPTIRLEATMKPFTNCAVDFDGPYITVQGRGRVRTKRYVFISLSSNTLLSCRNGMAVRYGWLSERLNSHGGKKRLASRYAE